MAYECDRDGHVWQDAGPPDKHGNIPQECVFCPATQTRKS
jgi:hypothetical protein